ncbi:MAG: winged helix-turn-helix transcriptional regulator [Candidatus Desulforudis sp.]|nr:winged helix-turn-helix transcriptional regulator [Desulforudis sp.]
MNQVAALVLIIAAELKLIGKEEVKCCGVTPDQGYLLMTLLETGPVGMQTLAEKLRVTSSTMTRNIDKLETAGLVQRVKSKTDARVLQVVLTGRGRAAAGNVAETWSRYFDRVTDALSAAERQAVLHGLQLLSRSIRLSGPCC